VLIGMGVASFCNREGGEDVRARLVQVVARAKERLAERNRDREPAWGEAKDGSAHDLYAAASRMLLPASTRGQWDFATERWIENGPVTAERCDELRRQWAPAVALLSEGAHRRDARVDGQKADAIRLGWILTAEFVSRLGEGATTAAVQLWLDGFTFTRDRSLPWPWLPLWTDERVRSLPEADLDLLAAGLTRLDRWLERPLDAEWCLATWMAPLLDGSWASAGYPTQQRLAAWRQGFDAQRWHLEAFDELLQITAVLSPAASDGAARQEQWRAYKAAPRLRATSWSESADRAVAFCERSQNLELTRLRLLRLAVAFHRRAPLPDLADPFGAGALEVRLDGDTAVFRSAGSFAERQRCATRR
jgi:hypothetical protein